MIARLLMLLGALTVAGEGVSGLSTQGPGHRRPTPRKTTRPSPAPRTPDGHPDLQGTWANSTITPLERPKALADKAFFTKKEAAEYEKHALERARDEFGTLEAQTSGELNETWSPSGKVVASRRTSLIVDPPDGRIPPLTPEAARRVAAAADLRRRSADDPESLLLRERCLVWGAGPPMIPVLYNQNVQIVQTRDYVMILNEMIHDVRVIPLDGRRHLPPHIRQWKGDSRGRWEGATLVVDTTNFTDKTTLNGSDAALHVVERFTRVDAGNMLYEFAIDNEARLPDPGQGRFRCKRPTIGCSSTRATKGTTPCPICSRAIWRRRRRPPAETPRRRRASPDALIIRVAVFPVSAAPGAVGDPSRGRNVVGQRIAVGPDSNRAVVPDGNRAVGRCDHRRRPGDLSQGWGQLPD
jgi:hypothetical protein